MQNPSQQIAARIPRRPQPVPSEVQIMAQSQDEEWLNRAATELSPLERQVLVLSARDRLSNAEIGAQLDIAPGRVERTLARAVARFDGVLAVEADRRAGLRRRCLRDWLRAIWRIVRRWRSP